MFETDPFIEEMLYSLNYRIRNGDEYMKDHPNAKKKSKALLEMKKRRRFLNSVYVFQRSIPSQLSDSQKLIESLVQLKSVYVTQNPEDADIYHQAESQICKEEMDAVSELLQAYDLFGTGYDFENLFQFFTDAETLLKKTVFFVLSVLDKIYPIPNAKANPPAV